MFIIAFFIIAKKKKNGNNPDVHWQEYVNASVNLNLGILYRSEHEWTTAVHINKMNLRNV